MSTPTEIHLNRLRTRGAKITPWESTLAADPNELDRARAALAEATLAQASGRSISSSFISPVLHLPDDELLTTLATIDLGTMPQHHSTTFNGRVAHALAALDRAGHPWPPRPTLLSAASRHQLVAALEAALIRNAGGELHRVELEVGTPDLLVCSLPSTQAVEIAERVSRWTGIATQGTIALACADTTPEQIIALLGPGVHPHTSLVAALHPHAPAAIAASLTRNSEIKLALEFAYAPVVDRLVQRKTLRHYAWLSSTDPADPLTLAMHTHSAKGLSVLKAHLPHLGPLQLGDLVTALQRDDLDRPELAWGALKTLTDAAQAQGHKIALTLAESGTLLQLLQRRMLDWPLNGLAAPIAILTPGRANNINMRATALAARLHTQFADVDVPLAAVMRLTDLILISRAAPDSALLEMIRTVRSAPDPSAAVQALHTTYAAAWSAHWRATRAGPVPAEDAALQELP